jgi:hypothetical protein
LLGERSRWALFDVSLQERSSALTKLWALARILLRSERPALTRSPRVTLDGWFFEEAGVQAADPSSPPPPPTQEDLRRMLELGRNYETEYPTLPNQ